MNRGYSYEYVREFIESKGYKLISTTYKNNKTPMELLCDKNHTYRVTLDNFKNKNMRCSECYGNKKYTYKYVKEYIENQGYKLISTTYKNTDQKLEMICDKNHECVCNFDNFKNKNTRCSECAGTRKYTYEYVKEYVEKEEFKLISTAYKNLKHELEMICPNGHTRFITFNDFKNKHTRCGICSEKQKHTYEFVKQYIESKKYKLISTEYIDNKHKLKTICDKGHPYNVSFKQFKIRK